MHRLFDVMVLTDLMCTHGGRPLERRFWDTGIHVDSSAKNQNQNLIHPHVIRNMYMTVACEERKRRYLEKRLIAQCCLVTNVL